MSFNTLKSRHDPVPVIEKAAEFIKNADKKGITGKPISLDEKMFDGCVYGNPSAPFEYNGELVMSLRRCKNETDDECVFVHLCKDGIWREAEGMPVYPLQDPYIAKVHGEYVFGGVKGWKVDVDKWTWLCEFYAGKELEKMRHLVTGPTLMKDIRLVERENGKVGIFTRPQGILYRHYSGHIADIGYTEAENLRVMDSRLMVNAKPLEGVFRADEWGGVNNVYPLKNGLLGIIGHVAYGEGEFREGLPIHYFGMAFAFDPKTRNFTEPKIIMARSCFKDMVDGSRNDDVIFSGGILRKENGKAVFYGGVADKFVGEAEIDDPFLEYENL